MHPHTKKVAIMIAVSMGIITVAYTIPLYVVPVALAVSETAGCTDYGCANSTFTKCGGFSSKDDSSTFIDSWTKGMQGMMCIMGLNSGIPSNSAEQITLNKV